MSHWHFRVNNNREEISMNFLRRWVITFLKATNFDFSIKHHWADQSRLHLNSFLHKGYWWNGKNREADEMAAIAKLVKSGDDLLEVGGHIGYLTLYFKHLVGDSGTVVVFEPGEGNLKYLEKNIEPFENVRLDKRAVSNRVGEATFFIENFSGQNNSLLSDYAVFQKNLDVAGVSGETRPVTVKTTSLDEFIKTACTTPQFIKIDVEGAEELVVDGMQDILTEVRPVIMIETVDEHLKTLRKISSHNYVILNAELKKADRFEDGKYANSFCIPEEKYSQMNLE